MAERSINRFINGVSLIASSVSPIAILMGALLRSPWALRQFHGRRIRATPRRATMARIYNIVSTLDLTYPPFKREGCRRGWVHAMGIMVVVDLERGSRRRLLKVRAAV
jgi:hypothetical protein